MKKSFKNSSRVECVFTDDGISFYGSQQEVYFPYGCLDSINMSFLGVLQAVCHTRICSFAVDRGDRAQVKQLIKFAREAMKTAPKEEPQVINVTEQCQEAQVPHTLPPEEQLKRYKALFIQGVITKDEYDLKKRQLNP